LAAVSSPATLPPRALDVPIRGTLASLLAALEEIRSLVDTDVILRRAVELARDRIGLRRVAIFMLDRSRSLKLGSWGIDLCSSVVDQHDIVCDLCEGDVETLRRFDEEGVRFTVFENAPIAHHQRGEPWIARRGWMVRTPIRGANGAMALLFNDAGLTRDEVDESKQAHAAIFCSVLGTLLDPARRWPSRSVPPASSSVQKLVASAIELLDANPTLTGKELASILAVNLSTLAPQFMVLMGISLGEYRDRVRLYRFVSLLDRGTATLREAALQAGFGSYAQFHRVFTARAQVTPREYLRRASADRLGRPRKS
jgi:AraC-like DNA-binding protein